MNLFVCAKPCGKVVRLVPLISLLSPFSLLKFLLEEIPQKTNKTLAVVQKTAVGGQCVCATTVCRSNTKQHVIMTSKANRPSGLGFMDVC